MMRGRTRRSPKHLLRLLPPVQLRELAYTVRRQPCPRADRARARLVREHAHGKIEAAQVAGIDGVGDTHDAIRGAMAFTPISDAMSGALHAVWKAAVPRRSGRDRFLCGPCARLCGAFVHSHVAFHPPAQADDYRGDGAIGRTPRWRLLERERLRRTLHTSRALSVAGGRCVPTCSTSRPAPLGFEHGMEVPTRETSAPGRAASIVPRFFEALRDATGEPGFCPRRALDPPAAPEPRASARHRAISGAEGSPLNRDRWDLETTASAHGPPRPSPKLPLWGFAPTISEPGDRPSEPPGRCAAACTRSAQARERIERPLPVHEPPESKERLYESDLGPPAASHQAPPPLLFLRRRTRPARSGLRRGRTRLSGGPAKTQTSTPTRTLGPLFSSASRFCRKLSAPSRNLSPNCSTHA